MVNLNTATSQMFKIPVMLEIEPILVSATIAKKLVI